MRFEDFEKVAELRKELDYVGTLYDLFDDTHARIKLGTHDVRPDLRERLVTPLREVLGDEIGRIRSKLVRLGVTL